MITLNEVRRVIAEAKQKAWLSSGQVFGLYASNEGQVMAFSVDIP